MRDLKTVLIATTFFLFGATMLVSCGSGEENHQHDGASEHHDHVAYICPMKCEGEKTYHEPGKCSVCGMAMVETDKSEMPVNDTDEQKEQQEQSTDHDQHNH